MTEDQKVKKVTDILTGELTYCTSCEDYHNKFEKIECDTRRWYSEISDLFGRQPDTATGPQLDRLGIDFGIARVCFADVEGNLTEETDEQLRQRIKDLMRGYYK